MAFLGGDNDLEFAAYIRSQQRLFPPFFWLFPFLCFLIIGVAYYTRP
jgi:hypothetical protein